MKNQVMFGTRDEIRIKSQALYLTCEKEDKDKDYCTRAQFFFPGEAQSSYLKHPSVQTYILKAWMMSDALIFSVHLRQYQHSYGFVMCSSEQFEHLHLHEKMLILNKFL